MTLRITRIEPINGNGNGYESGQHRKEKELLKRYRDRIENASKAKKSKVSTNLEENNNGHFDKRI